jgi:hypothetical protein
VLAVASVITFVKGKSYTQADVQPTFPWTKYGIGVLPVWQERGLNKLLAGTGMVATHIHGTRQDILNCINADLPVIVNIALPWDKGVGHAIVAVGYDSDPGYIIFYDPARGDYYTEDEIRKYWNRGRDLKSFDELLASTNGILGPNSLVIITPELPTSPNLSPGNNNSGKFIPV